MSATNEWERFCMAVGYADQPEGQGGVRCADVETVLAAWRRLRHDSYALLDLLRLRDVREEPPYETANVLWWRLPVVGPPYCGAALDEDFPTDVTHWSPLPEPYGTEDEGGNR